MTPSNEANRNDSNVSASFAELMDDYHLLLALCYETLAPGVEQGKRNTIREMCKPFHERVNGGKDKKKGGVPAAK